MRCHKKNYEWQYCYKQSRPSLWDLTKWKLACSDLPSSSTYIVIGAYTHDFRSSVQGTDTFWMLTIFITWFDCIRSFRRWCSSLMITLQTLTVNTSNNSLTLQFLIAVCPFLQSDVVESLNVTLKHLTHAGHFKCRPPVFRSNSSKMFLALRDEHLAKNGHFGRYRISGLLVCNRRTRLVGCLAAAQTMIWWLKKRIWTRCWSSQSHHDHE